MRILVTAANGNQGRYLIPRLVATGARLRACVRSETSAATLRSAGVTDVLVGDIADPEMQVRALREVDSVYYVGPALHPAEQAMGLAIIRAAGDAGVTHFVLSSVLHAILTDLPQHQVKRDLEEQLLSSGMDFTILQPANYMLRHRLIPAFEHGVFRLSWNLERRQSMVDVADVAEVASTVLTNREQHAGATYELAAPGRYTAYDIARVISQVIGRDVVAELIAPDAFLQGALGVANLDDVPYQADLVRAISKHYSAHDFVGNPNTLTWLLGRQPTTFEQFVEREHHAVQHQ